MGILDPLGAGPWARAFLGTHMTRLRVALAEKDRGASAIELAVITAVMIIIALLILAAVRAYVTKKANDIQNSP
ncbi:MAG: hypothetical protein J2P32_05260 [Actinobacteria bacterium]|nr:hypothetical protein [Actinomycetota bacterium]